MPYNPDIHRRRSIRLRGWDYRAAGAYFVTICTYGRAPLFGDVADGAVRLSAFGRIVEEEWLRTAEMRPSVTLDAFVVMPNHIHGIIWIGECDVRATWAIVRATCRSPVQAEGGSPVQAESEGRSPARPRGPQSMSLGAIIAGFKSASTRRINELRGTPGAPVWHRNYWDHIIRHDRALDAVRRYVAGNPARWAQDPYNPAGPRGFAIRAMG